MRRLELTGNFLLGLETLGERPFCYVRGTLFRGESFHLAGPTGSGLHFCRASGSEQLPPTRPAQSPLDPKAAGPIRGSAPTTPSISKLRGWTAHPDRPRTGHTALRVEDARASGMRSDEPSAAQARFTERPRPCR